MKILSRWGGDPYLTVGTSFEQIRISLPQGCSLLHINAFRPGIDEKFSLFLPLIGPQIETGLVVFRRTD